MAPNISPGNYSIRELLDAAGFDFMNEAAVDYNADGWDRRRIRVGGLSFDDLDERIIVPESADSVSISVDGEESANLSIE